MSVASQEQVHTLERLVNEAASLFRKKGYSTTTTRELAAAVGIQNASLYHHVRSKEDLLYAICCESLKHIQDSVQTAVAAARTPGSRPRALVIAHLTTALSDQDKHATMLTELRHLSPERRAEVIGLRDNYEAFIASIFDTCQQEGVIRSDISSRTLTLALLNLLNWTIFWFKSDGPLSSADLAEMFCTIFFSGATVPATAQKFTSDASDMFTSDASDILSTVASAAPETP